MGRTRVVPARRGGAVRAAPAGTAPARCRGRHRRHGRGRGLGSAAAPPQAGPAARGAPRGTDRIPGIDRRRDRSSDCGGPHRPGTVPRVRRAPRRATRPRDAVRGPGTPGRRRPPGTGKAAQRLATTRPHHRGLDRRSCRYRARRRTVRHRRHVQLSARGPARGARLDRARGTRGPRPASVGCDRFRRARCAGGRGAGRGERGRGTPRHRRHGRHPRRAARCRPPRGRARPRSGRTMPLHKRLAPQRPHRPPASATWSDVASDVRAIYASVGVTGPRGRADR